MPQTWRTTLGDYQAPDLAISQLLWLEVSALLPLSSWLRFKLSSIFSISISHTSGQALGGFLGSVLRTVGSQERGVLFREMFLALA